MMPTDRGVEINDVAPTSLNHIIGQRSVVDQVRVGLDAAFEDARRMDSCLLVGPPGCGKSALARVIAAEMATDFHEVIGQSISCPADLNAFLLTARERAVCHIDEAHELRKEYQTALYLALDQRKLFTGGGKEHPEFANCGLYVAAQHDRRILPAPTAQRSNAARSSI